MNDHAKRLAEIRERLKSGYGPGIYDARHLALADVAFLLQTIDDLKSSGEAAIRSMVPKPDCNCDACTGGRGLVAKQRQANLEAAKEIAERMRPASLVRLPVEQGLLPRPLTEAEVGLLKRLAEGSFGPEICATTEGIKAADGLLSLGLASPAAVIAPHIRITDRGRAVLSGEVGNCYVKKNAAGKYELCGERGAEMMTNGAARGVAQGFILIGPIRKPDAGYGLGEDVPPLNSKMLGARSPCGECCPPTGPATVSYRDVDPSRISFGTGDESPLSGPDEDTEINDFPEPLEPPDMDELGEAGAYTGEPPPIAGLEKQPSRKTLIERELGIVHFTFDGIVGCAPNRNPDWTLRSAVPREVTCRECLKRLPQLVAEFRAWEASTDEMAAATKGQTPARGEDLPAANKEWLLDRATGRAAMKTAPPIAPAGRTAPDPCSDPKPNVVTDDNEADVRPQEPVCVCASPTMHEPLCAWAIWRKKARG